MNKQEFYATYNNLIAKVSSLPQPAIEYCITAGPGCLIDYGVCEGEMGFPDYGIVKKVMVIVSPTTTACETGK